MKLESGPITVHCGTPLQWIAFLSFWSIKNCKRTTDIDVNSKFQTTNTKTSAFLSCTILIQPLRVSIELITSEWVYNIFVYRCCAPIITTSWERKVNVRTVQIQYKKCCTQPRLHALSYVWRKLGWIFWSDMQQSVLRKNWVVIHANLLYVVVIA